MVFINHTTKQMAAKIVYFGPGLSGKTTNLKYIHSKTSPDSRGEMVSLETDSDRTLFFDLLPIEVGIIGGYKTRFQLYTVPGQVFYESTRSIVLKGLDGIVFVADSQKPMLQANLESLEKLKETLEGFDIDIETTPMVIQYNKRDLPGVLPIDELNKVLNPRELPFFEAAAEKGTGVFETLKGITKLTLKQIKKDIEEKAAQRKKVKISKDKIAKKKDEFSDTKPGIEIKEEKALDPDMNLKPGNISVEVEEDVKTRNIESELLEIDHSEISSKMMENVAPPEDSIEPDSVAMENDDGEEVILDEEVIVEEEATEIEAEAHEDIDNLLDTDNTETDFDELEGFDELEMDMTDAGPETEIVFDRTDEEELVETKIDVKRVKVKSLDVEDVFKNLTKNSLGTVLSRKRKPVSRHMPKIDLGSVGGSTTSLNHRKTIREKADIVAQMRDFRGVSRLRVHLILEGDGIEETLHDVMDLKLEELKNVNELNLNLNLDIKLKK